MDKYSDILWLRNILDPMNGNMVLIDPGNALVLAILNTYLVYWYNCEHAF